MPAKQTYETYRVRRGWGSRALCELEVEVPVTWNGHRLESQVIAKSVFDLAVCEVGAIDFVELSDWRVTVDEIVFRMYSDITALRCL